MAASITSFTSDTLRPWRAIAARSISIDRYCWPVTRSTRMSVAPGTPAATRAISSAFCLSRARSSPKTLTATSERTPVTISSTRSEIGWAITTWAPGSTLSFSRMASVMSSWVQPAGHSSRGLRLTMGVDSFWPWGSAGDSPRPTPEIADFTPGTSITSFIACISILIDSSREMLGTRLMPGTTEPSFISGMKAVPRKGNIPRVATSSTALPATTLRLLPTAQWSILR